jgi:hypothetical protein
LALSRQLLYFGTCPFPILGCYSQDSGTCGGCPPRAHSNIYPITPCVLPSCHLPPGHHAVFKALHSARLRPSSRSSSPRISYRAPIPLRLRSCPPELTRTCAQRHIWSGQQCGSVVLYQYHSGRKAVLRHDRYGQVRLLNPPSLHLRLTLCLLAAAYNPSSDLWVAGTVPNAKSTGSSAKVQYAVGAAQGALVFFSLRPVKYPRF